MSHRMTAVLALAAGSIGGAGVTHLTGNTATVDAKPGKVNQFVPILDSRDIAAQDTSASSDLATTTISPERIIDTRPNAFSLGGEKEPWGSGETRTVQAAELGSIPSDAVGVVVNITALNATGLGTFLTVFPTGSVRPEASTLNPVPGEIAFNAATVLLGGGSFEVYNYTGEVDVIIDVTGYLTTNLRSAVDQLQSYTAILKDSAGDNYPVFLVNGLLSVHIDGGWYGVTKTGFNVTTALHYLSSDCVGPAYVTALDKSVSDTQQANSLLYWSPVAVIADGTQARVTIGGPAGKTTTEARSVMSVGGTCSPYPSGLSLVYDLYEVEVSPLRDGPQPPFTLAVVED